MNIDDLVKFVNYMDVSEVCEQKLDAYTATYPITELTEADLEALGQCMPSMRRLLLKYVKHIRLDRVDLVFRVLNRRYCTDSMCCGRLYE